ncbi:MAG: hypothetical protein OEY80_04415 [Nitrospirota bacterium]|nr:hypothetical protein [Nitrospirota bacterium]
MKNLNHNDLLHLAPSNLPASQLTARENGEIQFSLKRFGVVEGQGTS